MQKKWGYFGTYGKKPDAIKRVKTELKSGYKGDWRVVTKNVGKSVDNAYSDSKGYAYEVWIELAPFRK